LKIPVDATLSNGMPISVYLGERVSEAIRSDGFYEPETVKLLAKLLQPGMTFLDIGAHVGQYTLIASKIVGPTGQVCSFEAEPNNFACLQRNIATNNLANVKTFNVAIADTEGELTLHLGDPSNLGTNSLAPPHNASGNEITVKSITLDIWKESNRIDCIDFIKVDIEGAEYRMLLGSKNLLNHSKSPFFIMELNRSQLTAQGAGPAELISLLRSNNYDILTVEGLAPFQTGSDDPDFLNIVAVPEHRMEELLTLTR